MVELTACAQETDRMPNFSLLISGKVWLPVLHFGVLLPRPAIVLLSGDCCVSIRESVPGVERLYVCTDYNSSAPSVF